jgi:hypothetical protein
MSEGLVLARQQLESLWMFEVAVLKLSHRWNHHRALPQQHAAVTDCSTRIVLSSLYFVD